MDFDGSDSRYELLKQKITGRGSMLIACSGGVDSALLAAIATDVPGMNAHCVSLDSPLVPRSALIDAHRIGRDLGFSPEIITKSRLNDMIRKNPGNRCYYCKKEDGLILQKRARERGLSCVADGINLSDMDEYRPGIRASTEEGVIHPFVVAGITKEDIRTIAKKLGYDFWNKPSAACLSSRIPYGEEITHENLRIVERAEDFLHAQGFLQVRVRLQSGTARIKGEDTDLHWITSMRNEIVNEFKNLGITYVTLDLEEYRSGSMDGVLKNERWPVSCR